MSPRRAGIAGRCLVVLLAAFVSFFGAIGAAMAAPEEPAEPDESAPESLATRFDELGLLYRSEANPIVQEAWILGRYHGQYHWSEGNSAQDESWENRRFRIGGQFRFFEKLFVHAQMVSAEDLSEFYGGFTEIWVGWRSSDALMVTIGQQKHRFTHDRNISSRYLSTLERSQLTNMFGLDYTPAVTLSGRSGRWAYYGGAFTNATGTDIGSAFIDFDSGGSFLAIATYDLSDWIPTDSALLNGGYVYSRPTRRATNLNRYDHGVATALILTEGPLSLVTEVTAGFGFEPGDAVGINVQPGWYITDELQLAARYQIAGSGGEEGLNAQRRYELEAGMSSGELYQAGYLGLNYLIVGHRLKLMSGVEYSTLGGDHLWTGSLAVRLFWGPHSPGPFPMAQRLEGTWD